MLKIYDKSSSVTFPNLKTYTPQQLAESDDYRSMMEYTTVISIDSDGITSAFYRLANLAEMYNVEEQENPEETLRLIVEEIEREPEPAPEYGTDPQLQALATLQISTMSFDKTPCDEVVKFVDYWPEWKPDTAYKHNAPLTYQGRKFRASKDLTSQAIYPPGTAESEYYEVTLAPDGIIVWYNVGGEYNMVYKGEKRHYPNADGPVYEALENTSYSPDAYPQHWKKVEGEA